MKNRSHKNMRKQKYKWKIRDTTIHSLAGLVLVMLAVLVALSFTGQGVLLRYIQQFLASKLGLGVLFLPPLLFLGGLVSLRSKWSFAQPNVFLGWLLMSVGLLGLLRAGEIGSNLFINLSFLINNIGASVLLLTIVIIGGLIFTQSSLTEWLDRWLAWQKLRQKQAKELARQKAKEEEKKFIDQAQPLVRKQWLDRFSLPKIKLTSVWNKKNKEQENQGILRTTSQPQAVRSANSISSLNDFNEKTNDARSISAISEVKPKLLTASDTTNLLTGGEREKSTVNNPAFNNQAPLAWQYPDLSLLSQRPGGQANRGDVNKNAQIIEDTLKSFGITAKVAELNRGPAVTQYALNIAQGTKISKVVSLASDLALALAAPTGQIRIEAPIAGKSLVGVEVPNYSASFVTLREMLSNDVLAKHPSKLAVALGLDVSGKPVVADIASMPHLLIAGATGSGKSVAINAFMCSILFRASPQEVKFILVDPKRVELTGYNDIPHLLTPVIVEPSKVVSALKWATNQMDNRYKLLAQVGVKNIQTYNEIAGFMAMPNIIIIIDELADIMLFSPTEVEENITRLAQMARAVGIHLVLATQRPSVDVITGLIKANIPARMAFNVSSMMDSRVILDTPGAEKLLGKGDMLYIPPDQAKPKRIQGTFVSDQEIRQLIDFIKSQGQTPQYSEEITNKYKPHMVGGKSASLGGAVDDRDPKFIEAVRMFAKYDKASSSMIQRRLSVGYARAARILDQMCEAGLVGVADGSKPREVNMSKVQDFLSQVVEEE